MDKKYLPIAALLVGTIVFGAAFFYASKKSSTAAPDTSQDNQLTTLGTEETVLSKETEVTETPAVADESPTSTIKPKVSTHTVTPVPTFTPSLTLTTTPGPTTQPSSSVTPSVTITQTPTPTTLLTQPVTDSATPTP